MGQKVKGPRELRISALRDLGRILPGVDLQALECTCTYAMVYYSSLEMKGGSPEHCFGPPLAGRFTGHHDRHRHGCGGQTILVFQDTEII